MAGERRVDGVMLWWSGRDLMRCDTTTLPAMLMDVAQAADELLRSRAALVARDDEAAVLKAVGVFAAREAVWG